MTTAPAAVKKDMALVGLRTALTILGKWQTSTEQAGNILRISRSTISRARTDKAVSLDEDQLKRVSLVLNIHSALRMLFDNPANVYGFMRMENHNEFFNGRSPLDVVQGGDMIALYETFRRIDSLRGAQW
ncbi:antitoxin Xre-like helix-turn-helix domain-containing protein [Halopseudomonas maritima]|uniref:antitoxin Xre-like helix-turn-helix domain-containing protein n=1 Tax=Halopseudomonas maritima TaxID=2918528 RepID=UPI001EEA4510|nr:antitoxin Xre-like helix-turn-helix domain-containing protein [Halopseudomonas maritima]UJJ32154.1 MbcA/ParS/Xre antitoxin family protein [Halopseudomonas maritima]